VGGSPRARSVACNAPERFLSTIQIGITVIGATAGAFGGATFAADVEPLFRRVDALAPYARELALVAVVTVISYLSLVLGELVPKSLALRATERYALTVARPIEVLGQLLQPAVWGLTVSSNALLRAFGVRTSFSESRLSADELRTLVVEAREGGTVADEVGEIASRAIELGGLTADDVMIHRRFVVALPVDAGQDHVRRTFLERGHQRLPVYAGSIDTVLGFVSWRDVVTRLLRGEEPDLRALLRPCLLVPESTPAPLLLERMREQRQHLAIAVDEHGGTAGLVTLEDLLEELVGEITSEHGTPPDAFRAESGGSAVVQGTATVRDVNRELGLSLPEPATGTTIAGLCVQLAGGSIPATGDLLVAEGGARIEVLEASTRRVRSVRLRRPLSE
jgi:putative hemolysin